MEIFRLCIFLAATLLNIFSVYMVLKYRNMFLQQHENFMQMAQLVDKYKKECRALHAKQMFSQEKKN
jgi:hypothetical protein